MKKSIFALLLVVFIDAAGMGILFPILNSIIMNPAEHFLPLSTSITTRHFYYSLVIGIFFIAWFFGATFISKASDGLGRKKALIICLLGVLGGYILTIIAIEIDSLLLLILGRVLSGLTAGSQSVSQAAIIDISRPEDKAKNLGLILTSFAIGMVLGPVIGGVFSDQTLSSYFNNALPFYVILGITVLDLFLILVYFKDIETVRNKFKFNPLDLITQFGLVVKDKRLLKLSIIFFLAQIAFNTVYVFIDVFLFTRYHFSTFNNSVVMLIFGASYALSCSVLVRYTSKILSHTQTIMLGLTIVLISLMFLVLIDSSFAAYFILIPFMAAFGLAYISMLTLFSNAVSEKDQGWVMGITVSLFTLGAAITSLCGGWLMNLGINLPFIFAIAAYLMSIILFFCFRKSLITLN
jgi:predicted MFS family arabinose efflux permease